MTPNPRTAAAGPITEPAPTCGYTVQGTERCAQPATHLLPAGTAASSEDLPLCAQHAARFLGAAQVIR